MFSDTPCCIPNTQRVNIESKPCIAIITQQTWCTILDMESHGHHCTPPPYSPIYYNTLPAMQLTWPWPPVSRFSHDLIIPSHKKEHEHKVVRLLWELDWLHFAQYISIRPHGIDCTQTWCKTIYRIKYHLVESLVTPIHFNVYSSRRFQPKLDFWGSVGTVHQGCDPTD